MAIKRSPDQDPECTLEEFYADIAHTSTNHHGPASKDMLVFIEMLNGLFPETQLWGLTSLTRLIIHNKPVWHADDFVIVSSIGAGEYFFEYLMPEDKRPWAYAMVSGTARNLEEAKRYLLVAMKESGGWAGNVELKKLLDLID